VQQINEVGVVKTVDFFARVFVRDVRYKYNVSLFMYTCTIVRKTLWAAKTTFESVDISHIQIFSTRMQL